MQALSLDNRKKRCNEFITKIKATDKMPCPSVIQQALKLCQYKKRDKVHSLPKGTLYLLVSIDSFLQTQSYVCLLFKKALCTC